jgi:hypothetical protein
MVYRHDRIQNKIPNKLHDNKNKTGQKDKSLIKFVPHYIGFCETIPQNSVIRFTDFKLNNQQKGMYIYLSVSWIVV